MIAALAAWHEAHEAAAEALAPVGALPAHVAVEAYSVLTRLPGGLAAAPQDAASVLRVRFPEPVLDLDTRSGLLDRLARSGVAGGAAYDGLVALQAAHHGHALLTLDRRALTTYARLGVDATLLSAPDTPA